MLVCLNLAALCYATYVAAQTCSPMDVNVPGTINKRLNSYQISHLMEFAKLERCALECLLVSRCKSFNYRVLRGVCELNAVNLDEADAANYETEADFEYHDIRNWNSEIAGTCSSRPCGESQRCVRTNPLTCVDVDCGPPRKYLVQFRSPIYILPPQGTSTSLGSVAKYECIGSWIASTYLYRESEPPYLNARLTVCSSDGQWSKNTPDCLSTILSCESVRACNPAYGDGHYWVYHGGYLNEKTKVYCHDMAGVPKTYVTLPQGENVAYDAGNGAGSSMTVFSKIRIPDPGWYEFTADPSDFTFATSIGGNVPFGEAASCLTENNEKVYGYFKINTSGTGLKLRTSWNTSSTGNTELVNLTVNGLAISGYCWGSCGRCFPGILHLDKYSSDEVDGSDTVYVE